MLPDTKRKTKQVKLVIKTRNLPNVSPKSQMTRRILCILGDPGADRGGKGKSKRANENGNKEKYSRARRAPGDTFSPDQFQTAGVVLNSDWCQKFFVFFCPIRGQLAVKSFHDFLHGDNLIAILAQFVWQGFARGESLNHSTKCAGNRSEYRRRNTLDLSNCRIPRHS